MSEHGDYARRGPSFVSVTVDLDPEAGWHQRSTAQGDVQLSTYGEGRMVGLFVPRAQIARLREVLDAAERDLDAADRAAEQVVGQVTAADQQEAREDAYLRGDDPAGQDSAPTDGAGDGDVQD